jgi:hypothetical protein
MNLTKAFSSLADHSMFLADDGTFYVCGEVLVSLGLGKDSVFKTRYNVPQKLVSPDLLFSCPSFCTLKFFPLLAFSAPLILESLLSSPLVHCSAPPLLHCSATPLRWFIDGVGSKPGSS